MRALLSATVLSLSLTAAAAQVPSFDMSPERNSASPSQPDGSTAPKSSPLPQLFAAPPESLRHYLLQSPTLRLQGETAVRQWAFNLTAAEAASAARFILEYTNAITVAPEASRLTVSINNAKLIEETPRGAEYAVQRLFEVPEGMLKPGRNTIRVHAQQRHRTDCSIDSTFELWTDLQAENTYLDFDTPGAGLMRSSSDIATVGVGADGVTRMRIVVPSLGRQAPPRTLLQLAQTLALATGAANTAYSFSSSLPASAARGELVVLVGTTADLSRLAAVDADAASRTSAFIRLPEGGQALTVSAADWPGIANAIRQLADATIPPVRETPHAEAKGATRISFSELGVSAQQFSGRRFVTGFEIGMPADFYAGNYGKARIYLDAAYSSDVLPGGSFNVTINGQLATTVPITKSGGAVLQEYPIRIPMRHFRPGKNTVEFEALLPTKADTVCAPGATANETPRFALFGTSELVIPEFARAKRVPDLAATAALGFPYAGSAETVDLVLAQEDGLTLSAAATVLGKLAQASGAPIRFETVEPGSITEGHHAILVGAMGSLPPDMLSKIELAAAPEGENGIERLDDKNLEFWQQRVRPGRVLGWFSGASEWLKRNFDLDLTTARLLPASEPERQLPSTTDIFLYQSADTADDTVRTIVSAGSAAQLANGAEAIALQDNWAKVGGILSYHDTLEDEMLAVEPKAARFLSISPLSFTNLRLVMTNWLASNFVLYSLILLVMAVTVGLLTNALLGSLGRSHDDEASDEDGI
ncbi:cellulose biosynthesis cyclic di-GMP-binding regulatory protein BcsB [Oricola sp.]|uniref:cellulose biosynthesis cyclic di-GMP-binding regulatory protein BcsB n=1 Tax=Oricola sp. TaxID=1979950 RepID=UPI0025E533FC|nr:cellulose biosynthesis cyclic di-GMP-binding regulatory protein BcsB [Oricola sp.]MCI5075886.1 cellulose biosynthesis cyclic di-GMP-binding regulatory protein BcsB [Oricola sp.]